MNIDELSLCFAADLRRLTVSEWMLWMGIKMMKMVVFGIKNEVFMGKSPFGSGKPQDLAFLPT